MENVHPKMNAESSLASYKPSEDVNTLKAKVKALSSLIEVSIIISSTLDLDDLMMLVMEKAQMVMKAEASSVMIINEEKQVLECPVALGEVGEKIKKIELKMDEGIAGWVATHGEPQIVADVTKDSRFNPKVDEETGFKTHSILAVPLKVKSKIIGVAEVINRLDGESFNKDDLALFSTFCRQVAMAFENARIHQLELEKKKIEQQLESAKIIQQSFMPESCPTSPEGIFAIEAKNLPAALVGGDFFDFIEFDKERIGFTIGDVSGKGIPAALFMARLISDFRLYTQLHQDPSLVLNALNQELVKRSRRGMFVTSLYGILDIATGGIIFANAGHLPFIKLPANRSKAEVLSGSQGIPLGIVEDAHFPLQIIQLQRGEALIMITDGLIEARNRTGENYGMDRVVDILSVPEKNPEQLVDDVIDDICRYTEGEVQHDDMTVLVIQWQKLS